MTTLEIIAMITSVLSIAALIVAGIQTLRLQELRKHTHVNTWHLYYSIRALLKTLPETVASESTVLTVLRTRIDELYRQTIKQIALLQDRYDEDTIRSWRETGNVESEWEEVEFRRFLQQGAPHRRRRPTEPASGAGLPAPRVNEKRLTERAVSEVDSESTQL